MMFRRVEREREAKATVDTPADGRSYIHQAIE
jgi:hypothetical protein